MKNTNTVTLTQDALTAIIAQAVAQAMQSVPTTQAETVPTKAAGKKAAKKDATAQAKRDAHKARVATWDTLAGKTLAECIAVSAACIVKNRAAGVTNPNIDATDIRHFLTTQEHQALRRATWKAASPLASFGEVRDALVAAVSAQAVPAKRTRKAAK